MNLAKRRTRKTCDPIESQQHQDVDKAVDNDLNDGGDTQIQPEHHAIAEAVARQLFKPVNRLNSTVDKPVDNC